MLEVDVREVKIGVSQDWSLHLVDIAKLQIQQANEIRFQQWSSSLILLQKVLLQAGLHRNQNKLYNSSLYVLSRKILL